MSKKIEINENETIRLYCEQSYTLRQIAEIFNCSRSVISRFLIRNGIELKRYKREYASFYKQSLTDLQKDLVYGSLLGDGGDGGVYMHHDGINSCRYMETHALSQYEYLVWKKNILQNFITKDIRIVCNKNTKTYGNKPTCVLSTVLHRDFVQIRNMFYPNNKKIIPYFKLTPLSFAAWFYDDGSVSRNGSNSWFATLHTEGFSMSDVEVGREMLRDSFGLETYIINVRNNRKIIRFNNQNYRKICEIIRQHTIPCMAYKNKLFDNPVETCSIMNGASDLQCSDANMSSSLTH